MAFCTECKCCEAQAGFELCVFCEDRVPCPVRQKAAQRAVTPAPSQALVPPKREARRVRNPKSPWRGMGSLTLSDNAPLKPTTRDSAPALQEAPQQPQQVVQVPTAGKNRQEEKKERTTMRLTDEERAQRKSCACGTLLRKDNSDGVCKECRNAGKKASDTNGNASPKRGRPRNPQPAPPRKSVSKPAQPANGIATICVTEANLNSFWMGLSLEEKANLFQRQLEGA